MVAAITVLAIAGPSSAGSADALGAADGLSPALGSGSRVHSELDAVAAVLAVGGGALWQAASKRRAVASGAARTRDIGGRGSRIDAALAPELLDDPREAPTLLEACGLP